MIKVGVAGLGYWGPKLARNFAEMPDVKLAWVCDLSRPRAGSHRVSLSVGTVHVRLPADAGV